MKHETGRTGQMMLRAVGKRGTEKLGVFLVGRNRAEAGSHLVLITWMIREHTHTLTNL